MNTPEKAMATVDALVAAPKDKTVQRIVVSGHLADAPSVSLSPGQSLRGAAEQSSVTFAAGIGGLRLLPTTGFTISVSTLPRISARFSTTPPS
jgi:hypothetical protein